MSNFSEETTKQAIELEIPSIPAALDGGLLPTDTLSSPIIVHLKVWAGARPQYTYQLLWDHIEVGVKKEILPHENPGDLLTLELPVNVLTEGYHQLAYETINPISQVSNRSPTTPIEVDRTAPGNPLIAPMIFPPSVHDGLTSTELEELGDVLEATIASYNDMKEGDVIRTYWGTVDGPITTVDKDDMGLKKVMIPFTRDFLENLGDIEAAVYYTVTDRAGNKSMDSEPVIIKLLLSVVTPLPDPKVKEAKDDGTVDPADTVAGATVVIDASANLRQGDVVSVSWQGPVSSDTKEKTISSSQAGKELSVIFTGALVAANVGHTVNISYIVTRANGADQPSGVLELLITAGLSNLEKPLVLGVVNDVLVPETVPETGVTVTVPRYTGIVAKDSIIVKWAGGQAHSTPPQVVETVDTLDFTVPKAIAVGSAAGAVAVTYEVTRGASAPVASNATQFDVSPLKPTLTIDTSELVLSARFFRHGGVPTNPPAGAFANDRVASGGQPPYVYSVDNPVVNIDAHSGRVISLKSGSARVTVTDSAGNSASYPVKVSGVLILFGTGLKNTFTQCNQAASRLGGAIPSLALWGELRKNYGNVTHMEGGLSWASDSAGIAQRWAIDGNTGVTQALKDVGFGGGVALGYAYKAQ